LHWRSIRQGNFFTSANGGSKNLSAFSLWAAAAPDLYLSNGEQLLGCSLNAKTGAITELSTSPYSAGIAPLSAFVAGTIQ